MRRSARRRQESGYALLFIFLIAAVLAISLYTEIPRVAFESQRQKEQLLVERGDQYKRAIQVFLAVNKRWPATMDELENLNNRRFLRKRFTDPMTGKEWRLIHISNGVLIDSLVVKPKNQQAAQSSQSQLVGEIPISAADTTQTQAMVNPAMRRRTSDGATPGMNGMGGSGQPVDPNNPNASNPQNPGYPGQVNPGQQYPGQPYPGMPVQPGQTYGQSPVLPPGVPSMPGQPGAFPQYPGQTQNPDPTQQQYPGQVQQNSGQVPQYPGQAPIPYPGGSGQYPGQSGQYPGQPVQQYPGMPGMPGQPVNSQFGGASPYQTMPGANGNPAPFGQPGLNPQQQGSSQASQMIQQILTSPRPGGMPTSGGAAGTVGAGIAGVATTADSEGIMLYHDHSNYKEWEFIFDPSKVKPIPNPLTGALGTSAASMGSMPQQTMGQSAGQTPGQPPPPTDPFATGQTTSMPKSLGQ